MSAAVVLYKIQKTFKNECKYVNEFKIKNSTKSQCAHIITIITKIRIK